LRTRLPELVDRGSSSEAPLLAWTKAYRPVAMRRPPPKLVQRLVSASEEVLRPDPALRLEDIAALIGSARATLYYHFSGRDDLVAFLLEENLRVAAEAVRNAGREFDGGLLYGTAGHDALVETARELRQMGTARIVLADPHGSALYSWKKTGKLEAQGSSITEGIGTTRITANFEGTPVDDAVRVSDQEAVTMVYRLLREEGLYLGGSTGINVAAAVEVARTLGPGHTVVTLLCDRGSLYFQRLFNPAWLKEKGLVPG